MLKVIFAKHSRFIDNVGLYVTNLSENFCTNSIVGLQENFTITSKLVLEL